LNNNIALVSIIEEVYAELGEPNCKLINPYQLIKDPSTQEISLNIWPDFTDQRTIMITSDHILTITDPTSEIIEKYFKLIS
jgi:hypothetical protein